MTKRKNLDWNDIQKLEIDENNQLYWQGQKVVTEMMLKLPRALELLAGGAALVVTLGLLVDVADRLGAFPVNSQPPIEITVNLHDLKAQK